MNKIQNGDFSSGFDYFDNGVSGGEAYVLSIERARAISYSEGVNTRTYKMKQDFASNDEVVTGTITVWCKWIAPEGITDGSVKFKVELVKPDSVSVTLLDTTKTAESDESNLLDGYDIKAHLSQYGNYKLWLTCEVVSARTTPYPHEFEQSWGYYDNINVNVAVKKYKTVHEKLGSSGALGSKASVSRSEIVGLVEAYSTETFSPTFNYQTACESVGLSESYSRIVKRIRGAVEVVGLVEAVQAKRIQGNLETTYVLDDLTQWTEISKVSTPWIKKKIEI